MMLYTHTGVSVGSHFQIQDDGNTKKRKYEKMASATTRVIFRVVVGILAILVLFYVGRPLYWKISATVQEIRENKRTVKQGLSVCLHHHHLLHLIIFEIPNLNELCCYYSSQAFLRLSSKPRNRLAGFTMSLVLEPARIGESGRSFNF